MSPAVAPRPINTLADLLERLGGVSPDRIRWQPRPGTATVDDLVAAAKESGFAYELVEGVLVEKPMAWYESSLAAALITFLNAFVIPRNLGVVTGEQGSFRLFPDLVRIPDVAFTNWDRLPGRRRPTDAVPSVVPNLAVEILSESNTDKEMARKREDYFAAGVQLVWIIDPVVRTASVFRSEQDVVNLTANDVLEGGDVLSGFRLPLADLFAELDRHG